MEKGKILESPTETLLRHEERERKRGARSTALNYLSGVNQRFIDQSIDIYIKYESLEEEYKNLRVRLGADEAALPSLKSSQRKLSLGYHDYYTRYTAAIVRKAFSPTIDRFDYCF